MKQAPMSSHARRFRLGRDFSIAELLVVIGILLIYSAGPTGAGGPYVNLPSPGAWEEMFTRAPATEELIWALKIRLNLAAIAGRPSSISRT
jgi:hypothetical protein